MNEEKTLTKESEVLISEAKKSANSTITHGLKLIIEGKHLRVNFSEFDIPCRSCMGKLSIESDDRGNLLQKPIYLQEVYNFHKQCNN